METRRFRESLRKTEARAERSLTTLIKRSISTALIRLGPENPLVTSLIRLRCRQFGASFRNHGDYLTLRKDRRVLRLATQHFAYAPDVAKHFDLHFSPLVPREENGDLILDFSKPGLLQTYADSGLQFEMASLPEEADAIEGYFHWYKPQPGDTVFDVGAHCGVSAYYFSKLVGPRGKVIAFEPDPVNYSFLVRNIERHKLTNVEPVQVAISDKCGSQEFNCEGATGSGLTHHIPRACVGKVVNVETITLQEAFSRWGSPHLCKIDIEGAEIAVLKAAAQFLPSTNSNFVLDTSHFVDGSLTAERVEAIFRSCGYETLSSSSGMKTTWARPNST